MGIPAWGLAAAGRMRVRSSLISARSAAMQFKLTAWSDETCHSSAVYARLCFLQKPTATSFLRQGDAACERGSWGLLPWLARECVATQPARWCGAGQIVTQQRPKADGRAATGHLAAFEPVAKGLSAALHVLSGGDRPMAAWGGQQWRGLFGAPRPHTNLQIHTHDKYKRDRPQPTYE
jgi:hypothetical protein